MKKKAKGSEQMAKPISINPDVKAGETSRVLAKINELYKLPPIKTDQELSDRIDFYFQWCIQNDIRPGVEGLALATGVSRKTLWSWESGVTQASTECQAIVHRAKLTMSALLENWMSTGKINPITGIFWQKNNFGYEDVQQVQVAPPTDNLALSPDDIAKAIQQDLPIDADYRDIEDDKKESESNV